MATLLAITGIGGADSVVSLSASNDASVVGSAPASSLVTVYYGNTVLGSVKAGITGTFSYSLTTANIATIGQGNSKSLTITSTDSQGIVSSPSNPFTFAVKTVAPLAPVINRVGGTDSIVSSQSGDNLIQGTSALGTTVTLTFGSTVLGTVKPISDGSFSYALTAANITTIGQGTGKVVSAKASDPGGVSVVSNSLPFVVKTIAPLAPSILSVGGRINTVYSKSDGNLIAGTAAAGSTVSILSGTTELGSATADASGAFSYLLTNANIGFLGTGLSKSITAKAKDTAGNISTTSNGFLFDVVNDLRPTGTVSPGLQIELFEGIGFVNLRSKRTEKTVNFGDSYDTRDGGNGDTFSIRATGQIQASVTGTNTYRMVSDDGVKVWINGNLVLNNWTDHPPTTNVFSAPALTAGQWYDIKIEFYERGGGAVLQLQDDKGKIVTALRSGFTPTSGIKVELFEGIGFSGKLRSTRIEETVKVNDQYDVRDGGDGNTFSTRVTGQLQAYTTGTNNFRVLSDDGVRVWVNGTQVVNNWGDHAPTYNNFSVTGLTAGEWYDLVIEHYENGGVAVLQLEDASGKLVTALRSTSGLATTAVASPKISSVGGSDAKITNQANDQSVIGTGLSGQVITFFTGTTELGKATVNTSGAFNYVLTAGNLATLGQGSGKSITALATDGAGNKSSASPAFTFAVQTAPPVAPTIISAGGTDSTISSQANDNLLIGTAVAGSKVSLFSGTTLLGTTTASSSGGFSYAISSANLIAIGQGLGKIITAKATDSVGNVSAASNQIAFAVKTITPVAPTITAIGGIDKVVSSQLQDNVVTGNAPTNTNVTVYFGSTALGSVAVSSSGVYSYALTPANLVTIGQGAGKLITTKTSDIAGISNASAGFAFALKSVAPVVPTILSVGGTSGTVFKSETNNLIAGTAGVGDKVTFYSGTSVLGSAVADNTGSYSYTLTAANLTTLDLAAAKSISANSTDSFGNVSSASSPFVFKIENGLRVSSLITSSGVKVELYEGKTVSGQLRSTRVQQTVNINDRYDVVDGGNGDTFSTRITGQIQAYTNGSNTYRVVSDDGVRVWINGVLVLNNWTDHPPTTNTFSANGLTRGEWYDLKIEYYENGGGAVLQLLDTSGRFVTALRNDTASIQQVLIAPPTITSVGGSDGVISTVANDNTVVGTALSGSKVVVYSGSTELGSTTANSSGVFTYTITPANLATLGQGSAKGVTAKVFDGAGNSSVASSNFVFTVKTVLPDSPTIISIGGADATVSTKANDSILVGKTIPAGSVELYFGSSVLGKANADSTGSFSYVLSSANITLLGQGSRSIVAKVADAFGNVSALSTAFNFSVRTTLPQAPSITSIGGSDKIISPVSNDNTVVGTALAASTIGFYSGTIFLGQTTANSQGTFSYSLSDQNILALGQGAGKTLSATSTDVYGNVSKASAAFGFTIKTLPPAAPIITSIGGVDKLVTTNFNDNKVAGTALAGTSVSIYSGSTLLGSALTSSTGTFDYALTADNINVLGQGSGKSLAAKATDIGGTSALSTAFSFGIRTVPPAPPVISNIGGSDFTVSSFIVNDNTVVGTAESGSTIQVYSGSNLLGTTVTSAFGAFSYALTMDNINTLGQGISKEIFAKSSDDWGNTSKASTSYAFSIVTADPVAPWIDFVGVDPNQTANTIASGTAFAGTKVTFYISGNALGSVIADASGNYVYTFSGSDLSLLSASTQKLLIAKATDYLGNVSVPSAPFEFSLQNGTQGTLDNGSSNPNTFLGTSGNDDLTGSYLDEFFDGKEGVDTITGLGGADTYIFSTRPTFVAATADHLTDYTSSDGDIIKISASAFGSGLSSTVVPTLGLVDNTLIDTELALSSALSTDSLFVYDRSSGYLYWNQNGAGSGSGTGGVFAVLDTSSPLTSSGIVLY